MQAGVTGVLTSNNNLRYKYMFRILATFALICGFLQVAPLANAATDEEQNSDRPVNVVIEWNRTLLAIVRTPGAQPATVHTTRNFAILHAAIYDAVNAIDTTHRPYLIRLSGVSRDAQLQQSLAQIQDGNDKVEGIRVGQTVAGRILALRSNDGSNAKPIPYV